MYRILRTALLSLAISGTLLSLGSCRDIPVGAQNPSAQEARSAPQRDNGSPNPADAPVYRDDLWECGRHNGKQLYSGPRGGCYYINSNGNKTYVDRDECDCLYSRQNRGPVQGPLSPR